MSIYTEYIEFMEKYRDELKLALVNEQSKRQALLQSNMDELEVIISQQQAQTMKLKTLEEKRIKLQAEISPEAATASEFAASMTEGEEKNYFKELISEILLLTQDIKEQNRMALELAGTNLKLLDTILQKNGFDEQKNIYGPDNGRRNKFATGKSFEGKV